MSEAVAKAAKRLLEDLHWAAPELWPLHTERRIEEAIEAELARVMVETLPDPLDAAWAEARAAADALFGGPTYIALAGPEPWPDGSSTYRAECGVDYAVRGLPSPAIALRALAAKLREPR